MRVAILRFPMRLHFSHSLFQSGVKPSIARTNTVLDGLRRSKTATPPIVFDRPRSHRKSSIVYHPVNRQSAVSLLPITRLPYPPLLPFGHHVLLDYLTHDPC